ncbi:hypothetical protein Nmel_018777 [Mimus melanotis]
MTSRRNGTNQRRAGAGLGGGGDAGPAAPARSRSRSRHGPARRPRGAPGQSLPGPRGAAGPAQRCAGWLQPLRERRGERRGLPGDRGLPVHRSFFRAPEPSPLPAQSHLSPLPLQPPPPFQTPSVAPPPPVPAAAQPPRKPSPTEPRNYGSYGSQVRGKAPPGPAGWGDTAAGGNPGFVSPPQASAAAATAELLKRQEELNRKAEELDRRERELQNAALGSSQSEWLRGWGGTGPPRSPSRSSSPPSVRSEAQQLAPAAVLLPASTITLFLNFLSSLAWFCVDPSSGSGFGLSILWALLYTPCSFVCWYRPMYKAFRSDSSFNFFVFFFVFFAQNVMYVLQAIGIPNWGFSGWILSLIALRTNTAVAVMMILVSLSFTAVAVLGIIMLKKIHSLYRRTGASFQKAQEEFAAGVFSNQAVRTAAANAAAGAATNAFRAP